MPGLVTKSPKIAQLSETNTKFQKWVKKHWLNLSGWSSERGDERENYQVQIFPGTMAMGWPGAPEANWSDQLLSPLEKNTTTLKWLRDQLTQQI